MRELAQYNLSAIGRIFRQLELILPQRYVRDQEKSSAPKPAGIVPVEHASKLACAAANCLVKTTCSLIANGQAAEILLY
jgi:hypothetical protein